MKKEAAIHIRLRHPSIVIMMATIFEENNYGIVLEYLVHGSLDKFVRKISSDGLYYSLAIFKIKLFFLIYNNILNNLKLKFKQAQ